MCVVAEDALGSFFGRHTDPPSAEIPAASAGKDDPAGFKALVKIAGRKRSSAQQQICIPTEEPLSLNNIVPCPHPQSGMVFREPLHLGLGSPLMRDLLSRARGEMSSMSLEMADTNPWLFRNDTHSRPHCKAKAAAAGNARRSVCSSTAATAQSPAHVLLERGRSSEPARDSSSEPLLWSNWTQGPWCSPGLSHRSGTFYTNSSKAHMQAPSSASVVDNLEDEALFSPCTSVSSSTSSLSSLNDVDEKAPLTAAKGSRAPDILRRARRLANALLPPVSVLAAYRPIGRQWRLAKPGQPAAAPATVSTELFAQSCFIEGLSQQIYTAFMNSATSVHESDAVIQSSHTNNCLRRVSPGHLAHARASCDTAASASFGLPQDVFVEKLMSTLRDGSATAANHDPVLARDVSQLDAMQRRLRTIFWMHRLPVYRARVLEIYDSTYGGGPPIGKD